jgi:predicted secreted protein
MSLPEKPDAVVRPDVVQTTAFLLKISNGEADPTYTTVAGLRLTRLSGKTSSDLHSVSVSGVGIFTGSSAETRIKNNALSGQLDDYELNFDNGDRLRGKFLITRLDYAGDFNGERFCALALESFGQVVKL